MTDARKAPVYDLHTKNKVSVDDVPGSDRQDLVDVLRKALDQAIRGELKAVAMTKIFDHGDVATCYAVVQTDNVKVVRDTENSLYFGLVVAADRLKEAIQS